MDLQLWVKEAGQDSSKCLPGVFSGSMLLVCLRYVKEERDAEKLMLIWSWRMDPSAGTGIEYCYGKSACGSSDVRLLWEPYFFFQRDINKKLGLGRNDFITLNFTAASITDLVPFHLIKIFLWAFLFGVKEIGSKKIQSGVHCLVFKQEMFYLNLNFSSMISLRTSAFLLS